MFGKEVRMPVDILFRFRTQQQDSYGEYVTNMITELQVAHEQARKHLKCITEYQHERYNTNTTLLSYKPGDLVWELNETRTHKKCQKLQNIWAGPYIVMQKLSDLNFQIQINARGKRKVVHHDKVKPYLSDDIPRWICSLRKQLN